MLVTKRTLRQMVGMNMAVDVDVLSDVIDFKTVLVKVPIDEGKYHRQGHVTATKSQVVHTKRRIKRNV